jgi:hypothetical protein
VIALFRRHGHGLDSGTLLGHSVAGKQVASRQGALVADLRKRGRSPRSRRG